MNLISEGTTDCICAICGADHSCASCTLYEATNHVPDNKVPTKARLSLPKIFNVNDRVDGTHSIICKEALPKGTLFGPLEANRIFSLNPDIFFPLKIFTADEDDYFGEYYLNNVNENECNWLMFVAPAANLEEQNAVCYQDKEKIYYLTIRDIDVGEELKVWYAPFYSKKMDKPLLLTSVTEDDEEIPLEEALELVELNDLVKKQPNVQEREVWTCKFCSTMFSDVVKFAKHILEHYEKQLLNQCEYCNQTFKAYKSLKKHIKLFHSSILNGTSDKTLDSTSKLKDIKTKKDTVVGGPLLNDILTDSMDNTNLLLSQSGFDISFTNENILMETDNLNVDNLLMSENVKELDHFNFELAENQEQFVCDICLKEFSKLKQLYLHLNKHTGKYYCKTCHKIFSRKENLLSHDCINREPQFICEICKKKFSLKKYLIRHQKCHHQNFVCNVCKKGYESARTLKNHVCIDTVSKSYKCEICPKTFSKYPYMRKHMKLHTEDKRKHVPVEEQEKIICEVCSNVFSTMGTYNSHMKTHGEPKFSCEACGKKFHKKFILDNHLVTHEAKDVEFKCPTCNKAFKSKKYLNHHVKCHDVATGNVPCSECPRSFVTKSTLRKHLESVHKKKCNECDASFESSEEYTQHKNKHFDSYYNCPVCERNVKLRSSLRRHVKKVHPDFDLTDTVLNKCLFSTNNTKTESKNDNINQSEDVSLDAVVTAEVQAENSKKATEDIAENFESTDISSRDVEDQIEKTIGMDQSDYEVDDFDDLDLKFEEGFQKAVESTYNSNSFNGQSDLGIPITSSLEESTENILDFNNLEMELDGPFNSQSDMNTTVCVSMPELVQDVVIGDNAYALENGTIIQPQDQGNVIVYYIRS